MPLHDWSATDDWENLHFLWIARMFDWIKPRLPEGFRAFVGSSPRMSVGRPIAKPDLSVRAYPEGGDPALRPMGPESGARDWPEPDFETTTLALETEAAIFIESRGWFVAAVELVSPRNKDRPDARDSSTSRFVSYLNDGVNLLLIDVLPRPSGFSFADRIAEAMDVEQAATPTPFAASYRVGEPAAQGGKYLAIWNRPMAVGQPLPTITLPLTVHQGVAVDLERTYATAAENAYLD